MHLERLGLDHLLRGGVRIGVVELIIALHGDLRGRHSSRHGRDVSLLGQVVNEIVKLIVFEVVRVVLGLHLVLVVLSLLRDQVGEYGFHVHRGALLHASLHGARLQEEGKRVSSILSLLPGQLLVPPRGVALFFFLSEVLHFYLITNSGQTRQI